MEEDESLIIKPKYKGYYSDILTCQTENIMEILNATEAKELTEFHKKAKDQRFKRAVKNHKLSSGIMQKIKKAASEGVFSVSMSRSEFDSKGLDIAVLEKLGYCVQGENGLRHVSWGK